MHPELLEDDILNSAGQSVISIPQMAPDGAITRNSENAIDFLNRIKNFHGKWIKPGHITGDNTHNVSATVTVKNGEWESVGEWMWQNKDSFNGLSFMPEDLGSYQQTPFETITEEEYHRLYKSLQRINVADIVEMNDNTNMSDNLACSGGNCEII